MNIQINLDDKILDFVKAKSNQDIKNYIYDIVENVLVEQDIYADIVDVSIQSVTDAEIKDINKKYRNVDRATDVLSFPIFTMDELKNLNKTVKEIDLGDIFLCLDVIERQSIEYGTGIVREVLYMITHGMCHLTGHDHEIEEEKIKMRQLEEKVLNKVGVGRVNG